MKLDEMLLARLKQKDPTLTKIDLSHQTLKGEGEKLQRLVDTLAANTHVMVLDLSFTQIGVEEITRLVHVNVPHLKIKHNCLGPESAKLLAQSDTLVSLDVSFNEIGNEGIFPLAKNSLFTELNVACNGITLPGIKALAQNTTLTVLNLGRNPVTNECAKELANMKNLTALDVGYGHIDAQGAACFLSNTSLTSLTFEGNLIHGNRPVAKKLKKMLAANQQQLQQNRAQFIYSIAVLARDGNNALSASYWSLLPPELKLHVLTFLRFRFPELGASAQQAIACAHFILTHASELNHRLAQGHGIKIVEKRSTSETSLCRFRFFSSSPAPSPALTASHQLTPPECVKRPRKQAKLM